MKRRTLVIASLLGGITLLPAAVVAQERAKMTEEEKAMMAAYQAAARPGAAHERLASLAGRYTLSVKWWQQPGAPLQLSTATCERKMIMGSRYLVEEVEGQMWEQPFQGMGVTGYDNVAQQYVNTWVDIMGTGILAMTGNFSEGGKGGKGGRMVMTGEYQDPYTKKAMRLKGVTTILSDTEQLYEMYFVNQDGSEWKTMEIKYTKRM